MKLTATEQWIIAAIYNYGGKGNIDDIYEYWVYKTPKKLKDSIQGHNWRKIINILIEQKILYKISCNNLKNHILCDECIVSIR